MPAVSRVSGSVSTDMGQSPKDGLNAVVGPGSSEGVGPDPVMLPASGTLNVGLDPSSATRPSRSATDGLENSDSIVGLKGSASVVGSVG